MKIKRCEEWRTVVAAELRATPRLLGDGASWLGVGLAPLTLRPSHLARRVCFLFSPLLLDRPHRQL